MAYVSPTALPCTYYQQGRCAHGTRCRFIHSEEGRTANNNNRTDLNLVSSLLPAMPMCEFYKRGLCRYGDGCRFLHPGPYSGPTSAVPTPLLSDNSTSHVGPHAPPAPTSRAFGPCKFFVQGKCHKGDTCPFPHPIAQLPGNLSPSVPHRAVTFESAENSIIHTQIIKPSPETPVKTATFGFCKYFAQGRCMKGDTCPFWHPRNIEIGHDPKTPKSDAITSDAGSTKVSKLRHDVAIKVAHDALKHTATRDNVKLPLPDLQPQIELDSHNAEHDEQTTTRTRLGCNIVYGIGATVHDIVTAFESHCVVLHNVPAATTQTTLITLAERIGPLKSLVVIPARDAFARPSARVEYLDTVVAARAVAELAKDPVLSGAIARLDLRTAESGKAVLRSTKARLTWFAPSLGAWAHYPSLTKAREPAARLDRIAYNGKTIKAFFQTPSFRQRTSFSVELKGLPLDTSSVHLKRFCQADLVTIGLPSFIVEDSVKELRKLLSQHGPLEALDFVPPVKNNNKAKLVAFVQFADADSAEKAVTALHGSRQTFIRGSQIFLELIHSIKYMVPLSLFVVLRTEIDELKDALQTCKLRYHDKDENGQELDRVCVRAYGADAKALGGLKTELEQMMKGHAVLDDAGQVAWHDHLSTAAGGQLLDSVAAQTKTHVRCDTRTRTIHLFGNQFGRAAAKTRVLAMVAKLKAQENILDLDQESFRRMLHGGFQELRMLADSVLFDVVHRRLVVQGDESAFRTIREVVVRHQSQPVLCPSAAASDLAVCPVCYCDVTDPLMLPCGHVYCQPCLQHYLSSLGHTTGAGQTIASCLAEVEQDDGSHQACRRRIPLQTIRSLLSPDEEERLLETVFLSHIHARPEEFRYCPTADCQTVYRPGLDDTVLRCPSCLARVCASCHVEFHEGLTCAEFKDNTSGGNEAFERWRQEHGIKTCPGCRADLEKNGGCNHITCARCGTHICWVCMKTFNDTDSGGGVYAHMHREHGGIDY